MEPRSNVSASALNSDSGSKNVKIYRSVSDDAFESECSNREARSIERASLERHQAQASDSVFEMMPSISRLSSDSDSDRVWQSLLEQIPLDQPPD